MYDAELCKICMKLKNVDKKKYQEHKSTHKTDFTVKDIKYILEVINK